MTTRGMSMSQAPTGPRFRVQYWPCLGSWPFLVAVLFSLPPAVWLRRDAPPLTVQCTSSFLAGNVRRIEGRCMLNDPRSVSWASLPCDALLPAFDGLVDAFSVLHRLHITATVFGLDTAPADELFKVPDGAANGLDAAAARRLLDACVEADGKSASPRTVQVNVLDQDYGPSTLVVCAFLAVALIFSLRRHAAVDIDPAGALIVTEKGFLREHRTVVVPSADIAEVIVEVGVAGSLSGRRVTFVRHGGGRVPVTEAYQPLTYGVHEQAARRLRAYLGGRAATRGLG